MALEQHSDTNTNVVDGEADGKTNGGDDGGKAPRLPRWTRQEILVLIQGKRDAENKFRRGRTAGLPFGSGQVEPKWASVSSYCKKHGVNRGPVQCRKRWSNLAGDYKKIKEWESQIREDTDSFWVMRNDLRRERKLPGFFDKEVYDILDSGSLPLPPPLALALPSPSHTDSKRVADEAAEAAYTEPETTHLYDTNRSAAGEDGLFSDFEPEQVGATASPQKKRKKTVFASSNPKEDIPAPIPIPGVTTEKQPTLNPEMGSTSEREQKRKRLATDGEEESLQYQLIDVLERNGKMLSAQLEAQNINIQLDREHRKDHASNLVAVLDKLADALGRIADKL